MAITAARGSAELCKLPWVGGPRQKPGSQCIICKLKASKCPILYIMIMYINELADILREAGVIVKFFADDLKMYARITNLSLIHI